MQGCHPEADSMSLTLEGFQGEILRCRPEWGENALGTVPENLENALENALGTVPVAFLRKPTGTVPLVFIRIDK